MQINAGADAEPGQRIHDVAHACWQHVHPGPGVTRPAQAGRPARLICDAYGLPDQDALIGPILWWQDRRRRGIQAQAAAGDPAMTRPRDSGTAASVKDAHEWATLHRAELAAAFHRRPRTAAAYRPDRRAQR